MIPSTIVTIWTFLVGRSEARQAQKAAIRLARNAEANNLRRDRKREQDAHQETCDALEDSKQAHQLEREAHQRTKDAAKEADKLKDATHRRETSNLLANSDKKSGRIEELLKACKTGNFAYCALEAAYDKLLAKLDDIDGQLKLKDAQVRKAQREADQLREEVGDLKTTHQAERMVDQFAIIEKDERIANLTNERDTANAGKDRAEQQLGAADQTIHHLRSDVHVSQQSTRDAEAAKAKCIADFEEQRRVFSDKEARLTSRAEAAEQGEREAKAVAAEATHRFDALHQERLASKESEEQLKLEFAETRAKLSETEDELVDTRRQLAETRNKLQFSEAREEGLKVDIVGLEVALSSERSENDDNLVKLNAALDETDTLRTQLEGTQADGQATKPAAQPLSAIVSLADSDEDSRTPSLTFCESDAFTRDGPKNLSDESYVPARPSTPVSDGLNALTMPTVEHVTSDARAVHIVTSTSALPTSHLEPARDSALKRTLASRRPPPVTSGFLQSVEFRTMELPLFPVVAVKTSAVRPTDMPDIFSPSCLSGSTRAGKRFMRHLAGHPPSRAHTSLAFLIRRCTTWPRAFTYCTVVP
ncbi:unnamed protein product [Peniophora sp. CBMAI 1063]|nr:unnamed protein product [Peniophora sp. CBMAI 1063]